MASYVANKVTKRFVSGQAKKYEPEDPLYEFYTAPNGKQKRRKRPLPPGLTRKQAKLLKKINSALARIDSGEYGWCLETGDPIGLPRLLARPTAEYSIEAQERHEKKERLHA